MADDGRNQQNVNNIINVNNRIVNNNSWHHLIQVWKRLDFLVFFKQMQTYRKDILGLLLNKIQTQPTKILELKIQT